LATFLVLGTSWLEVGESEIMKPFKAEKDDRFQFASIEKDNWPKKSEAFIYINFETDFTPKKARQFAKWLLKAADLVEKENKRK
jgi:hypothetical protein